MAEPQTIAVEDAGNGIRIVTLDRPEKRNAISDRVLEEIEAAFDSLPDSCKAVVLTGRGGHFSAGLDLSEHQHRNAEAVMHHSRRWHRIFDKIEGGRVPVVAALSGAVIGGGLELACCAHIRTADETAFFQLPEGRRGIFVGGGATVRVSRLIGPDRMREMMLTGRRIDAADALSLGLVHYLCPSETPAFDHAVDLARQVASNAPLSNYMMLQAIQRISEMSRADGFFTESLAAALTQTSPDAVVGLEAFLQKRDPKFQE